MSGETLRLDLLRTAEQLAVARQDNDRLTAALKDAAEQQQERELEIRREYIEEIQSLTAALKDAERERERLRGEREYLASEAERLRVALRECRASFDEVEAVAMRLERERERLKWWIKAVRSAAEADPSGMISADALIEGATKALQEPAPKGAET